MFGCCFGGRTASGELGTGGLHDGPDDATPISSARTRPKGESKKRRGQRETSSYPSEGHHEEHLDLHQPEEGGFGGGSHDGGAVGMWSCSACTYENKPGDEVCEVCQQPRLPPEFQVHHELPPAHGPEDDLDGSHRSRDGGELPSHYVPSADSLHRRDTDEDHGRPPLDDYDDAIGRTQAALHPSGHHWDGVGPVAVSHRSRTQDSLSSTRSGPGPYQGSDLGTTQAVVSHRHEQTAPHGQYHERMHTDRHQQKGGPPLGTTQAVVSSQPHASRRQTPQSQHQHEESIIPQQMQAGEGAGPPELTGSRLRLRVLRAFDLRNTDLGILPGDVSDPFVVARLGRQEFKTAVIDNNLNPVWNSAQFEFAVEKDHDKLHLEVFNSNQWHAHDSLGSMDILLEHLIPGENHMVREKLNEGTVRREDGRSARLEVEVMLLSPNQPQGGGGRGGPGGGTIVPMPAPGGQRFPLPPHHQQKIQNWVPLPSFHGLGPEAFEAPKPKVSVDAPTGRARQLAEYESQASRLGQYDYSQDPAYYPKQEQVDKRSWKDDPFYGWRRDLQSKDRQANHDAIHNQHMTSMAGTLTAAQLTSSGRALALRMVQEESERKDDKLWRKDPFHGWLDAKDVQAEEGNQQQLQEVRVARQLMKLPSFHEAEVKRFADHREYSALHKIEIKERWPRDNNRSTSTPQQNWREDAFFGWLPGRGPDDQTQHMLHRPLEQARLNRLPSFSEDPSLRGITGRGLGILRVWINCAFDLAYEDNSRLKGKPSACVKVSVGHGKEDITKTIANNHDPCWNSPMMSFEVKSSTDVLRMEVLDLASSHGQTLHSDRFLGVLEIPIQQIQDEMAQTLQPPGQPVKRRDHLHGSQRAALLDFEILYEEYNTEVARPNSARFQRGITKSDVGVKRHASTNSLKTTGSFELSGQLGVLSVRVIAAYDLVNMDTGLFGDVSDPYVTMRLGSQTEKQRKRTKTINNDLNPHWNSSPFLFPLQAEDDTLILEVFDEDMLKSDDSLGRISIPLYNIVHGHPNTAVRIRDKLQDIQHGELEVEIGFSPG